MNDFFFRHTKDLCYVFMLLVGIASVGAAVLWGLVMSAPL